MEVNKHRYCILLAGGVGKRLWPCSRRNKPKQFIDFLGIGRTLIQQTYDRMVRFIPQENIYISTYQEYIPLVKEQLPEVDDAHILDEPIQLSTAPATAWASCHLALKDAEANILVTPCDQIIMDTDTFVRELQEAFDIVETKDILISVGVKATTPNRAYGYVQMGEELRKGIYSVRSFTEKPDAVYAQAFVESGEFLWNTGLFLWNSKTFLRLIERTMPDLFDELSKSDSSESFVKSTELIRRLYPANLHRSIDLVILDTCENVAVVEGHFGWADIGSWPALYESVPKDVDGNAVLGDGKVMFVDTANSIVSTNDDKMVYVKGLDNYLISQTEDVLVICPNDDPALAKKIFKEIEVRLGKSYT